MFIWTKDLSVGHDSLDDDHKSFFALANLLHDIAYEEGQILVLESAILLLQEYVAGHFLREQNAMRSAGYPDLDAHTAEHVRFTNHIMSLIADYRNGNADAIAKLGEVTSNWLRSHIRDVDSKYVSWIKDTDVDNRPLGFLAETLEDEIEQDLLT